MWKTVVIVIGVVVLGFVAYAYTRPDTFRVQRTANIKAPPEKVYALINDLGAWRGWSPWENKDPAMQRKLGGVSAGKGASYEWSGNKEVGKGRMEIVETQPPSKVVIRLDFFEPFEAHNTAEFALAGKGESTEVTWSMHGPAPFMTKVMDILFDMDKMIGTDFETGLASLKLAAER